MAKRPISITLLAWFFVVFGVASTIQAFLPSASRDAAELIPMVLTRILALVAGALMLRDWRWSRWLLLIWIGIHVVISLDNMPKLIVHTLLLIALGWFLFFSQPAAWFRLQRNGA